MWTCDKTSLADPKYLESEHDSQNNSNLVQSNELQSPQALSKYLWLLNAICLPRQDHPSCFYANILQRSLLIAMSDFQSPW